MYAERYVAEKQALRRLFWKSRHEETRQRASDPEKRIRAYAMLELNAIASGNMARQNMTVIFKRDGSPQA